MFVEPSPVVSISWQCFQDLAKSAQLCFKTQRLFLRKHLISILKFYFIIPLSQPKLHPTHAYFLWIKRWNLVLEGPFAFVQAIFLYLLIFTSSNKKWYFNKMFRYILKTTSFKDHSSITSEGLAQSQTPLLKHTPPIIHLSINL